MYKSLQDETKTFFAELRKVLSIFDSIPERFYRPRDVKDVEKHIDKIMDSLETASRVFEQYIDGEYPALSTKYGQHISKVIKEWSLFTQDFLDEVDNLKQSKDYNEKTFAMSRVVAIFTKMDNFMAKFVSQSSNMSEGRDFNMKSKQTKAESTDEGEYRGWMKEQFVTHYVPEDDYL